MIYLVATYAAVAMFIEDILGTLMVMAEDREKATLSGALDSLAWLAAIITTTLSVSALQGHSMAAKVVMISFVTVANFAGSWVGVKVGKKFIPMKAAQTT